MIVDGKTIAKDILARVREEVDRHDRTPVVRAIVMSPSPATLSYLTIKERAARDAGMRLELVRVENDGMTEDLIRSINLPGADAVIVQLPLPASIDTTAVLDAIPAALDADVLSRCARARFTNEEAGALLPPVVRAMKEILERFQVDPRQKQAAVVGQGWLVGEPAAIWLKQAGAQVRPLTRDSQDSDSLRAADIVILGAGSPGLVKPEHLKEGVVLIDAGTSESDGAIVGDADPSCADIAAVFTPVPGGVGPVAVACLFANVAELLNRGNLQAP